MSTFISAPSSGSTMYLPYHFCRSISTRFYRLRQQISLIQKAPLRGGCGGNLKILLDSPPQRCYYIHGSDAVLKRFAQLLVLQTK
jgi:hypothetical protein